ncbi:hypothetical protein ACIRON_02815 [Nocardioides sp. NPDC101246]|uniref:hypothetical protein n=1 Tax=Nocardioides sp. NPDC101246 TaxID=3364336 RepID=UPI003825BAE2
MTIETTKECVRGCSMYRRHLDECEGGNCRGCLPRRAEHGHLCWPCHRRFELMLTDAPTVSRWLTGNMRVGEGAARAKEDHEQRRGTGEPPAPLKLEVTDLRDLLGDQLAAWVDDLCEHVRLSGPGRHSVETDSRYLLTWLSTVERLDWVGDWWTELAETMSQAHALAPWRPEMKRCKGIPCPQCEETNLVIFGGEEDVTCLSCRMIIPPGRYGIWVLALGQENAEAREETA